MDDNDSLATQPGYGIAPSGFRLPAATHIGAVHLQISSLSRSVEYYTRVLGLRVIEQSERSAALGPHGDERVLVALHEQPGARPVPRRGRLGLFHFAVLLPDRASLGRFLAHLGAIGEYAGMSDHLVSEAIYLTDPDGLGIEVYADRPRDQWRAEGGQLVMSTVPLNVSDVLSAGGGERWAGAPAGTRMGHVHLHVGDLDRAAAFYHDALGFDKVVWGYPGALFLSAGGYHHHLGTNTWATNATPAATDEARLIEWELVLPRTADVDAAAASVERAGGSVERTGDGTVVARDPWGTAVRLRTHTPSERTAVA